MNTKKALVEIEHDEDVINAIIDETKAYMSCYGLNGRGVGYRFIGGLDLSKCIDASCDDQIILWDDIEVLFINEEFVAFGLTLGEDALSDLEALFVYDRKEQYIHWDDDTKNMVETLFTFFFGEDVYTQKRPMCKGILTCTFMSDFMKDLFEASEENEEGIKALYDKKGCIKELEWMEW